MLKNFSLYIIIKYITPKQCILHVTITIYITIIQYMAYIFLCIYERLFCVSAIIGYIQARAATTTTIKRTTLERKSCHRHIYKLSWYANYNFCVKYSDVWAFMNPGSQRVWFCRMNGLLVAAVYGSTALAPTVIMTVALMPIQFSLQQSNKCYKSFKN